MNDECSNEYATVKFNRNINDFQYILSFDLATQVTGWSLINISEDVPILVDSGVIDSTKASSGPLLFSYLYNSFAKVILSCDAIAKASNARLMITKERLPNQSGKFSTIATLQSLAQTHAIFQLVCEQTGSQCYDADGTHAISVKAYFKSIRKNVLSYQTELETNITKEEIRFIISKKVKYVPVDIDLNISDSIGVTLTLLNVKWNSDIDERVREIKRIIKSGKYKSQKKIDELTGEIERLKGLKVKIK